MKRPSRVRRPTSLLSEIGLLTILLSTVIILLGQFAALRLISNAMIGDLKEHALRTTAELAGILEEPLYILDDAQVLRIGEAFLSSGRVSGLTIHSSASGQIISVPPKEGASVIPSMDGTIRRETVVLGTFHLDFSDREVRKTREELRTVFLGVILAVLVSNMVAIRLVVLGRIKKAFVPIMEGLRAIGGGKYEALIPSGRYVDINELIETINGMARQIQAKSRDLLLANQTLEDRVASRTAELERSLRDLRLAQDRLVESEKLSALGQLSAGMAHELNTPLGAILSSDRSLADFFDGQMDELMDGYLGLSEGGRGLFRQALEIGSGGGRPPDLPTSNRSRRTALMERFEGLGLKCSPGLADLIVELGMQDEIELLKPWLKSGGMEKPLTLAERVAAGRRMVEVIGIAGEKAAAVVSALRSYLSPEAEGSTGIVDIEADLDKVLTLLSNMLKEGVSVVRIYGGVTVQGSAERLGQVWLNLLRNAAQAMNFEGEIEIRTELRGSDAYVAVIDTGPGVPEELQERIFDPFFTTKKPGEGIGLGLDICRQIVAAHRGTLFLESIEGRTAFVVRLPDGQRKPRTP